MSASNPLVRVSPASNLSTLFDAGEANETDRDGSDAASGRANADTAAEQNAPRDTLVVHAPGFGIESVVDEAESESSTKTATVVSRVVRYVVRLSHADVAASVSVVHRFFDDEGADAVYEGVAGRRERRATNLETTAARLENA
jgi:hypothetical protein